MGSFPSQPWSSGITLAHHTEGAGSIPTLHLPWVRANSWTITPQAVMEPYEACHSSRPHRERAVSTSHPYRCNSGLAVNQDEVAINAPPLHVRAKRENQDLKSEGRKAVTTIGIRGKPYG